MYRTAFVFVSIRPAPARFGVFLAILIFRKFNVFGRLIPRLCLQTSMGPSRGFLQSKALAICGKWCEQGAEIWAIKGQTSGPKRCGKNPGQEWATIHGGRGGNGEVLATTRSPLRRGVAHARRFHAPLCLAILRGGWPLGREAATS